ncbi:class I SAM-dependent methyltransferase [Synechococcus sp. UW140]|uniref:class I SAM-dependent methyltransferase n=1 Tax=Synechococcus sp. UW140 TaxID=368503 RepID=UPI0031380C88
MTSQKELIIELLHHGVDPFAFYVPNRSNVDPQGWNSNHPYLQRAIQEILPKTVLEVGVWKGGSVVTMASKLKSMQVDGGVIAVDTFRGSPEHWCNPDLWKLMNVKDGIPGLYDAFMSNVVSKNLQDYVAPLPVDSITAYEICKRKGVAIDLIHIDAGHEYESVAKDLHMWSQLLREGGIIIMDDYDWDDEKQVAKSWGGVAQAVNEYVAGNAEKVLFEHANGKCIISFIQS